MPVMKVESLDLDRIMDIAETVDNPGSKAMKKEWFPRGQDEVKMICLRIVVPAEAVTEFAAEAQQLLGGNGRIRNKDSDTPVFGGLTGMDGGGLTGMDGLVFIDGVCGIADDEWDDLAEYFTDLRPSLTK